VYLVPQIESARRFMVTMKTMPLQLFHASREQRLAFARERYFEEGLSPAGIVSDAVMQSWSRCRRARHDPRGHIEFDLVTHSRAQLALQRNRPLLRAWGGELGQLEAALSGTSCAAMLTDASGVLVASVCAGRSHERIMPVATRIGVNLSEEAVGTTAPGLVAKTGLPVSVLGAEHYFDDVRSMNCAAAPIRNALGEIVGVLDLSSEQHEFDFDAAAIVGLYAAAIENRLLLDESREHLVLAFQVCAPLLDTPMVGLAGIDGQGRLAWSNGVATRLLGLQARSAGFGPAEDVLGVGLGRLASLSRQGSSPLRLGNGLTVWMRSALPARDGVAHLHPVIEPAGYTSTAASPSPAWTTAVTAVCKSHAPEEPVSLRASDVELIARTLLACQGNVAQAARQLGVSRGLIYRRLKQGRIGTHVAGLSGASPPCVETEQISGWVIPKS
jgi:transcriptional regulator of acetoin/glycerol metabolism